MKTPKYFAIIPAAGVGSRVLADCPKQYLTIAGKAMLAHSLAAFKACPLIAHTFIVVNADDDYIDDVIKNDRHVTILRCGGDKRRDTVFNALNILHDKISDDDWVLVHDAARPGLTVALIEKLIQQVKVQNGVGGLLAMPVIDTVKRVDKVGVRTILRDGLWLAQTPQMFSYQLLLRALGLAQDVTDEASAVELLGLAPVLVEGSLSNFKVTHSSDIALASFFLEGKAS